MHGAPRDEAEIGRGSKIGRFVVVAELGAGGMGVVYAAHDRELDRQVALKVMRGTGDDEYEDRMRMLREGQAMARVTHPNVITVFEVGTEGSTVFLAQELLDGGTLGQWLEQPRAQPEILEKFAAAGRGLAAAHAAGLVHRDFKPDNVLLGKDGRVRVSDFGLARALGAQAELAGPTQRGGGPPRTDIDVTRSPMSQLTKTGAVMGTPMFMAPEQHEGKRADERSDQFAFCVALYHALYGDWPFEGKTAVALADNVINGVMRQPPPGKRVPAWLRKVLLRGLSTNPADRYPSMDGLLAELTPPASGKRMRIALVAGALVVVAGAAAAAYVLLARDPEPAPKPADPVDRTPVVVEDVQIDHPESLTEALDRGALALLTRSYENEAAMLRSQSPARAAASTAAVAFTLALTGELARAERKLEQADATKGNDPQAVAFADLARAAISSAGGALKNALEASQRCAVTFEKLAPLMASVCWQIHGETAADLGNRIDARVAFDRGLAIANRIGDAERTSSLTLALAQLEFDDKQHEVSLDTVLALKAAARRRPAVSSEAAAAVLASRIYAIQSKHDDALAIFDDLEINNIEVYRIKAMARIARGEVYGYREEGDKDGVLGLEQIDRTLDDAKQKGFWGVVLEAKLARVRVLLTLGKDGAKQERDALIEEANAKTYKRIARLAETFDVSLDAPDEPAAPDVENADPP